MSCRELVEQIIGEINKRIKNFGLAPE